LEVERLVHPRPTFHGDTIYAESRVLDKVASTTKEDRGVVTVETKAFNQHGDEVCSFRRKVMVWMRAAAPARRRPYGEDIWSDPAR
jgi:acyl dehydratase